MKSSIRTVLLFLILSFQGTVKANQLLQWQSTNIQWLKGQDYELGDKNRTVLTLEHANKWAFGDFYGFVDHSFFKEGGESTYGEITPRLSFSKLTGRKVKVGPFQDFFLSAQLEKGSNSISRYMMGIGTNIKIEGFTFFKANIFNRNNPDRQDTTWQIYLAWNYPFKIGEVNGVIEGYADIFGEEGGGTVPHQSFVPRLLFDISSVVNLKPNTLHLGIEWQYWHNKFGVNGVTESVPQLQLKWTM